MSRKECKRFARHPRGSLLTAKARYRACLGRVPLLQSSQFTTTRTWGVPRLSHLAPLALQTKSFLISTNTRGSKPFLLAEFNGSLAEEFVNFQGLSDFLSGQGGEMFANGRDVAPGEGSS